MSLTKNSEKSYEEPRFRFYQGRQQVYELMLQMSDRATKEILIVTTSRDLARLSLLGLEDRLRNISKKGKNIRILTEIDHKGIADIEPYIEFADIHHISLPSPIRFVVIDTQETLTTVTLDDSMSMTTKDDTGLWTNASSFATAMNIFYDAIWNLATPAKTVIESIITGQLPQEIKKLFSDKELLETFRGMIERSSNTLDIIAISDSIIYPSPTDFTKLISKNVKIRLITHINETNIDDYSTIPEKIEIRDNSALKELELVISDNVEAIIDIQHHSKNKHTVWSNIDTYSSTMAQVFEDYWQRSVPIYMKIENMVETRKINEFRVKLIEDLMHQGLTEEKTGRITGKSGKNYEFDIVFKSPKNHILGIYILFEREAFNKILELTTFSSDLTNITVIILSSSELSVEEKRIADLYKIYSINEKQFDKMASSISQIANTVDQNNTSENFFNK